MRVVLTTHAKQDLTRIGDYIALDSPARARNFVRELQEKARQIGEAPHAFPLVPRYETQGIRRRVYRDYLIFYRMEQHRVTIIHIAHGAQEYGRFLSPEE